VSLLLELEHQLSISLSPNMLLLRDLLYMDTLELESYVQTVAMDNPFVQIDDSLERVKNHHPVRERDTYESRYDSEATDPLLYTAAPDQMDIQTALRIKTDVLLLPPGKANAVHKVITYIESNGRLETSLEEIHAESGIPLELLVESLTLIQNMDPVGMGARSLSECLLLQLQRNEPNNALAQTIVRDHLAELHPGKFSKLAKTLSVSTSQVEACFSLIKTLNPYPSCVDSHETPVSYICEDLTVEQTDSAILPVLRDDLSGRVSIDPYYTRMLSAMDESSDQKWMLEKQAAAQALMEHLGTRKALLICLALYLFDRQPEFVRDSDAPLHALTLSQASKDLGLHISVLSRLISGKYIRIGHRLVPLRAFFSNGIQCKTTSFTPSQIQAHLKTIIAGEPKTEPFSDELLKSQLEKYGIHISRRTVAKYRDELGIPPAGKRKIK